MGPSRSSSLRIGDDFSTVVGSGWIRDGPGRSAMVEPRNVLGAPPLPLGKDKGKINLIKYPRGGGGGGGGRVRLPQICHPTCCDCGT